MGIVVNQGAAWEQGSSYIGYDNLYLRSDAVVAASSADAGFPASSGVSWLTTGGGWQTTGAGDKTLSVTLSAAQNINSYGIYKHNIGTLGLTVKLQTSTNGSTWTDVTGSELTPADDRTIYFVGATASAAYARIFISGMAAGETLIIGNAFIGESFQVFNPPEPGFVPPNIALDNKYLNNRSEGGDFMGRTFVRKGGKTSFFVSLAQASWIRSTWLPFMLEAEKHPFYYCWDTSTYIDESAYCYTDGKISKPKYVSSLWMSFDLKFWAFTE